MSLELLRDKMELSYRELRYKFIGTGASSTTAGEIMRDVMKLSSREMSRCKQFEDGVMCLRNGAGQDGATEQQQIRKRGLEEVKSFVQIHAVHT